MPWQDADLAGGRAGEDERRLARPDLPVDGNDLHVYLGHLTLALPRRSQLGAEAFSLLGQVVEAADQEESLLGYMVKLTFGELVERLDRLLHRHGGTGLTGELFGRHHVLREEPFDASRPVDLLLVLFGQLVDTQNRDDVLKVLVALQDPNHFLCYSVVLV